MCCDYYEITELRIKYKNGQTDYIDVNKEKYKFADDIGSVFDNTQCKSQSKYWNKLNENLVLFDNEKCWHSKDYEMKYGWLVLMNSVNIHDVETIILAQFNIDTI